MTLQDGGKQCESPDSEGVEGGELSEESWYCCVTLLKNNYTSRSGTHYVPAK